MKVLPCLAALLGLIAPSSFSRAAVVDWRFELTTDDGDDLVEPGEAARIRFLADFSPSVGEYDGSLDATIYGFGAAFFDLQSDSAWAGGRVVDWSVNHYLYFLTGDTSRLDDADQSIRDITCAQITELEFFDKSDPIFLLDITWSPEGDYTPRSAGLTAHARQNGTIEDEEGAIFARPTGGTFADAFVVPFPDASFTFQIVPAPGVCAALVLGGAFYRRR